MARARMLVGAWAALLLVAGCSSTTETTTGNPSPGAGSSAAGSTAPEYQLVPDAKVTAGLADVRRLAQQIKTTLATDQAGAQRLSTQMYDVWFTFEGTVRKNEKNLYLQMEDGLAAIKAGVEQNRADKVDKGLGDLEQGADNYLVKHP